MSEMKALPKEIMELLQNPNEIVTTQLRRLLAEKKMTNPAYSRFFR